MVRELEATWKSNFSIERKNRLFKKDDKAWISGVVMQELEYDHEEGENTFYRTRIKWKNREVQVLAPYAVLYNLPRSILGKFVEVGGSIYSKITGKELELYINASTFHVSTNEWELTEGKEKNEVYLAGYIQKMTNMKQAMGIFLKVRTGKKNTYIPCFMRDDVVTYSDLKRGDFVELHGSLNGVVRIDEMSILSLA